MSNVLDAALKERVLTQWLGILVRCGLGALFLVAAGAKHWWHVILSPEPIWAVACRIACLALAALASAAIFLPRARTKMLLGAGIAALLLPILLLVSLVTYDPASISAAVNQTNQASHLIGFIERSDINPYVGWTQTPRMIAYASIRNDYTIIDGLETAASYAKEGWYACLLGGLWLFGAAWFEDRREAQRCLLRWRVPLGLMLAVLPVGTLAQMLPAYYYMNRARAMQMQMRYDSALASYQQAARWDPHLDYDLAFHYELGRLYARSGDIEQPDYWATVAEMYNNARKMQHSYELYQRNVVAPLASPALTYRYAQILLKSGVIDYSSGLPGSALTKWESAIRMDPANLEIMYALAMGYTRVGSYPQAIRWWKQLISANESVGLFRSKFVVAFVFRKVITARSWSHMGWCYYQVRDYNSARYCQQMSTQQGESHVDGLP